MRGELIEAFRVSRETHLKIQFWGLTMRVFFAMIIAAAIGLNCASVQAASISVQSGQVLINNGQGFIPVSNVVEAGSGAQILVREGGVAIISYGPSCSVHLGGNRVWRIAPKAPCASGSKTINLAQPIGYVGRPGPWQTAVASTPPPPVIIAPLPIPETTAAGGGFSETSIVVAGVVVVVGVVAATSLGGGKNNPASP